MNKFITTDLGGLPFTLDDIRFQQDATRDALAGLLSTWGINPNGVYILSGCDILDLGSALSVSEGYIAIDGEVLKVESHVAIKATGLNVNYFEVVVSNDPNGLKTFDSGGSFDTYEVREAKVGFNTFLPFGRVEWDQTPVLKDIIKDYTLDNSGAWTEISSPYITSNDSSVGTGTEETLWGSSSTSFKYKKIGKTVFVEFRYKALSIKDYATNPAFSIVTLIPEEMKPKDIVQVGGIISVCVAVNVGGVPTSDLLAGNIEAVILPTSFPGGGNEGKFVLRNWIDTSVLAAFNLAYEFAGTPSRALTSIVATNIQPEWDIFGTFSYEAE
jgi:hypothetical protein